MTAPDDVGGDRADLGTFAFERGGQLPLTVAYETYGEYDGTNAVLLCHALTGSHAVVSNDEADQAVGWWNDVVGPGRPIDTDRYFVISMNVPGSCYGTTGPADVAPSTGDPYGSEYPPVTIRDWTHAQRRLIEHLGVDRLRAVVGGSVGGMNALDWAVAYPSLVDRIVAIATGARLDAQLVALSTIGRRAITADPAWQGGDYYPDHPDDGLAVARRLAHVTYRSKRSMTRQFGREVADHTDPFPYREVASYLDYNADRFVDRFDANSYVRLSRAMEAYDLARNHESDAAAVADFDGEALVVSVTTDWHFTVDQSRSLTDSFRDAAVPAHHEVVDSAHGHDAFLVEPERYASRLAAFLDGADDSGTVRGRRRSEG